MVNVVNGYGPVAGAALTSHMDIDKVIATFDVFLIIADIMFETYGSASLD